MKPEKGVRSRLDPRENCGGGAAGQERGAPARGRGRLSDADGARLVPGDLEHAPILLERVPEGLESIPGDPVRVPGHPGCSPGRRERIPGDLEHVPSVSEPVPVEPEPRRTSRRRPEQTSRERAAARREREREAFDAEYLLSLNGIWQWVGEGEAEAPFDGRIGDLARARGVTHVTAHVIVARLRRRGLVRHDPYGPVQCTRAGRKMARRARLWARVMGEVLVAIGVPARRAMADAVPMAVRMSDPAIAAAACRVEKWKSQAPGSAGDVCRPGVD